MIPFLRRIFQNIRLRRSAARYRGAGVLFVTALLIAYGTAGFYLCEREAWEGQVGITDALWWSIVTMTTVGYGDFYPKTWQGRWLVAVPTMVMGIGLLGYAIGLLTTWVIERHSKEAKGMLPFTRGDHVVICHYPSEEVLLDVVHEIHADGAWRDREVVLVTQAIELLPDSLKREGVHFVHGSPSRELILRQAGVERAHSVLILAPDPRDPASDNQTLGALVTVRAVNTQVYVVAECTTEEDIKLLRNAGADEVVGVTLLSAGLVVQALQDPGVNEVISELVTNTTGHQIYVEPIEAFRGTFAELCTKLRGMGEYAVLGLIVEGERRFLPAPDTPVAPGQKVMLLGSKRLGTV